MSFESDDISEITNETEELNNLFQRIKHGHKTRSLDTKNVKTVSRPSTPQKMLSLQKVLPQKQQIIDFHQQANTLGKNSNSQRLQHLHKFASFSESSFLVSSFGEEDDDDEIFEFITRKYPSPEKSAKACVTSMDDSISSSHSPSPCERSVLNINQIQVDIENLNGDKGDHFSSTKGDPFSSRFSEAPPHTSTPYVKDKIDDGFQGSPLDFHQINGRENYIGNESERDPSIENEIDDSILRILNADKEEENEHEITDDDEEPDYGDYESYFRRKKLKQQKADETFIKWNNKRQEFMNQMSAPSNEAPIKRGSPYNEALSNPNIFLDVASIRTVPTPVVPASSSTGNSISMAIKKTKTLVFQGCIIHVNGYTVPGINEIHKLVILNGGKFLHHVSRKSAVTHIIASSLTPRKHIEFKNYKVVKPAWVVDSVNEGKLQDWKPYCIIHKRDYGQQELQFGQHEAENLDANIVKSIEEPAVEPNNERQPGFSNNILGSLAEHGYDDLIENNKVIIDADDMSSADHSRRAEALEKVADNSREIIEDLNNEIGIEELQADAAETAPADENGKTLEFEARKALDSRNPEFLKYFFKNSRLHHLSNWRSNFKTEYIVKSIDKFNSKNLKLNQTKSTKKADRMLLYMDFDCFFARVSSMNYPKLDFYKLPLCVTHGKQTSDVSSCNYVARSFGVKNGMWIRDAKKLCPDLICLKYDFDNYENIARKFYDFLLNEADENISCILPISVDECIVEIIMEQSLLQLQSHKQSRKITEREYFLSKAHKIQSDIKSLTNCDVSIGVANNRILSRLSLKYAKPKGIHYINSNFEDPKIFLKDQLFKDLPGVGHNFCMKLLDVYFNDEENVAYNTLSIEHLYQKNLTLKHLVDIYGLKNGSKLFNYINGKDDFETLIKLLRSEYENHILNKDSISIDVNWGIRFENYKQVERFFFDLTEELIKRMRSYNKIGSLLTIKILKRIPNTITTKYLGLGKCELITKSSRVGLPTNDFGILLTELKILFKMVSVEISELRGIGVKISKLVDEGKGKQQRKLNFDNAEKNQAAVEKSFELPRGYEVDVFNNLPKEIQEEIKLQVRSEKLSKKFDEKNNIRSSETRKFANFKAHNNNAKNSSALVKLDRKQELSMGYNSSNDSTLITTQDIFLMNNPHIDKSTYNQLSTPLRTDLATTWKREEFIFKDKNTTDLKRNFKICKKLQKKSKVSKDKICKPNRFFLKFCLNTFSSLTNNNFRINGNEKGKMFTQFLIKELNIKVKSLMEESFEGALFEVYRDLKALCKEFLLLRDYCKLGLFLQNMRAGLRVVPSQFIVDGMENNELKNWHTVFDDLKQLVLEDSKGLVDLDV